MATKISKSANPVLGKTPFIDASTASDAYDESKRWMRVYFEPLDELERIARNRPSPKIDPTLPRVTDGTLAAIVQEGPKRIIQQIPTGATSSKDFPGFARIADMVLTNLLIPSYNRMGDVLQKSWNMSGKSMTYGRATSYTFFTNTNGTFHTDFVIPYAKDVLDEKGKVFGPDNNIRFMRSWYQKRDLQAIINKEKALQSQNKNYKTDWDLVELASFMEAGASAKPADQMTPAEKEKGGDTGGYEMIHAFQVGKKSNFYSFAPRHNEGKPIRTWVNGDPRGLLPLDDLYCNIDLSNPMGRGQVEMSGGVQNLIDQQMQMYQFIMTLLMGPPLQYWGNVNPKKLKFLPNALWDMGNSPTNKVVPYAVDNTAITTFPENYGLLKSQILQINNASQSATVSAEDGNPQFSKTQAGVQAQQSMLSISDNYLRKQFETWFSKQCESSENIFFSKMTGEKTMQLCAEDLAIIEKSEAKQYLKKDILTIPYSKISDVAFTFQVDASTSEVKQDQDNAGKLTEVLKVMQDIQDPAIQQKIPQLVKLIIDEIGAEGTDELFPEYAKDDKGQPVNGADGQPAQQGQPAIDPQAIVQLVQQSVQQALQAKTQAPKLLGESVGWTPKDLTDNERAQALAQVGIKADPAGAAATPGVQQQATSDAIDVAKTAHTHAMAIHNATQPPDQGVPGQADNKAPQSPANPADPASTDEQPPALTDALNPAEQKFAAELLQRGFQEADVEQAIMLLRQKRPMAEITKVLGVKRNAAA